jgi:hypothetical protein
MRQTIAFVGGALAFALAHLLEAARWSDWFAGTYDPWFLNSGRAIVFTLGCVAVVSAMVTAMEAPPRMARGVAVGAGASAAMTIVLFLKTDGPGTIFPIVLGAGAAMLFVTSLVGALAVVAIGRAAASRR